MGWKVLSFLEAEDHGKDCQKRERILKMMSFLFKYALCVGAYTPLFEMIPASLCKNPGALTCFWETMDMGVI